MKNEKVVASLLLYSKQEVGINAFVTLASDALSVQQKQEQMLSGYVRAASGILEAAHMIAAVATMTPVPRFLSTGAGMHSTWVRLSLPTAQS